MGISLALGGGGARGLSHVGVIKVLRREAIPVTAIAGTSMGAIIGAGYAAGVPVQQIEDLALHVRRRRDQIRLVDLKLRGGSGLLRGTRVYSLLAGMLGEERTFEDMLIPFAVVSVDLLTGREVLIRDGRIVDALRATMSVPGVFEPVVRGDTLLADGGVLNNVPVDVARQISADPVVAVDVLPNFPQNQPGMAPVVPPLRANLLPASVQDLLHAYLIMIAEITEFKLCSCPAEVIIRPDLPIEVGLLNGWERVEELIAAGEAAAEAALPQIRVLLERKPGTVTA